MAKPKVSPAIERHYLLVAEMRRRMCFAQYASDDVFWIRLAESEWRLLLQKRLGDEPKEKFELFYNEVGQAIGAGGYGSANRFEKAREAVARAHENNGPASLSESVERKLRKVGASEQEIKQARQERGFLHDVTVVLNLEAEEWRANRKPKLFCAWAQFCLRHGRLPAQAEFERFCIQGIYSRAILRGYRQKHGREPSAEAKKILLNSSPDQLRKEFYFEDRKDFLATCRSLGLRFQNGNDRRRIQARLKTHALDTCHDNIDPVRVFEGDPKLERYLVENWSLGDFFEWLSELRNAGAHLDEVTELGGVSLVLEQWEAHFAHWLEGLTSDGSISKRLDRPLRDAFWGFCDRMGFPPSAVETMAESSAGVLELLAEGCGRPREVRNALSNLRDQLRGCLGKGLTVYNIPVCEVPVILRAANRLRVDAAKYCLDGFGFGDLAEA
ncbi:MAG: hypothetical protein KDN19_18635 [Verrucomicrobiae bacterium]|nr:hypothetical protein [Verrucomicrobiae bacterium]